MIKSIFSIISIVIFLSINLYCQNDTINQTDELGNKIGYWEYTYDNGKLKSNGFFKLTKEPLSKEELFMRGIYDYDNDTIEVKIKSYKDGLWNSFDKQGRIINRVYFIRGAKSNYTEYIYD